MTAERLQSLPESFECCGCSLWAEGPALKFARASSWEKCWASSTPKHAESSATYALSLAFAIGKPLKSLGVNRGTTL